MDHIDILERALGATGDVVHGITPDQHAAPTPCGEWTVRDVLNHLVGGVGSYAKAAAGEPVGNFNPLAKAPELVGDDPAAAYDDVARRCAEAWRGRGGVEGEMKLWGPRPSPALFVWQIAVGDVLIHGWDLATATGQDYRIDDGVPAALLDLYRGTLTDEFRGTAFKPAVPVSDDAPALDRLVAFSGRAP